MKLALRIRPGLRRVRQGRSAIAWTVVIIFGATLADFGIALVFAPAAFIFAGVAIAAVGWVALAKPEVT